MKKITKSKNVIVTDNDLPTITSPHLDKLSAVVDVPDVKLCGLTFSEILGWIQNHEPGVFKATAKGKYHLAVDILYPDHNGEFHAHNHSLRLEITNPKSTKRQMRLEWNPAYITEAGEGYLNMMIQSITGMTFYELLFHARFTRVDVCMTIVGRNIEDYLFRSKYFKFSQSVFGQDGKIGSIKFGKPQYNQVIIYDKAKELFGAAAETPMLRIETRNRINLTPGGLACLPNPFKRVVVYSLACKHPPLEPGHWLAFQDSCRLRGVGNAIKYQPAAYRSKLKKALSEQPVTWWGIDDDMWEILYQATFENAGLCNISNYAPPLNYESLTGQDA